MTDCVTTGGEEVGYIFAVALGLGVIALGVLAVLVLRRRSGSVVGLMLAIVLGVSAAGSAPPATAHAGEVCPMIQVDSNVAFASGEVIIHGSYRAPVDESVPVAAAVIVGGTGAVDRDGNGAGILMEQYAWLADMLADQGIASLRYDKIGTGETGLGPYANEPDSLLTHGYDELRIQPVRAALSFLAAQPGIAARRLILIGHSAGGAVTISVAGDPGTAPAPAGLLLIEPSYDRILDVIPQQLAQQIDIAVSGAQMTLEDATTLKTWLAEGVDQIRTGAQPYPTPGPVPLPDADNYTALIQSTIENNIYGSDPAQMVISHAYRTPYGQQFDEIDAAAIAPTIAIPVLVTCGSKDFNTPCGDGSPGSGVAYMAAQFAPGVAHFVELRNVVHILRDVGEADAPGLADQVTHPFSSQLEREVTAFVAQFRH